jgi:WD40 repeat protein
MNRRLTTSTPQRARSAANPLMRQKCNSLPNAAFRARSYEPPVPFLATLARLCSLIIVVAALPLFATPPPLSREQLTQLLRNGTPDRAIGIEVYRRGIAFPKEQMPPEQLLGPGLGRITAAALRAVWSVQSCNNENVERRLVSANGEWQFSATYCGAISITDRTGKEVNVPHRLFGRVTAAAFAADQRRILLAFEDASVRILMIDEADVMLVDSPAHHSSDNGYREYRRIEALLVLPTGESAIGVSNDEIVTWSLDRLEQFEASHLAATYQFSPDRQRVEDLRSMGFSPSRHSSSIALLPSYDTNVIVIAFGDRVCLWDLKQSKVLATVRQQTEVLEAKLLTKNLFLVHSAGLHVKDDKQRELLNAMLHPSGYSSYEQDRARTNDLGYTLSLRSLWATSLSDQEEIGVYELPSGKLVRSAAIPRDYQGRIDSPGGSLFAIAPPYDAKTIALIGGTSESRLLGFLQHPPKCEVSIPTDDRIRLKCPAGDIVWKSPITASSTGMSTELMPSAEAARSFEGNSIILTEAPISAVAVDRSESLVATASTRIDVWNTRGHQVETLSLQGAGLVTDLGFGVDASVLGAITDYRTPWLCSAAGGAPNCARLPDQTPLTSQEQCGALKDAVGHEVRRSSLAFSPDGAHLATIGCESLTVWDVAAARLTWRLPTSDRVWAVTWLDRDNVVVGLATGELRIYSISSRKVVRKRFDDEKGIVMLLPDGRGRIIKKTQGENVEVIDGRLRQVQSFYGTSDADAVGISSDGAHLVLITPYLRGLRQVETIAPLSKNSRTAHFDGSSASSSKYVLDGEHISAPVVLRSGSFIVGCERIATLFSLN